MIYFLGASLQLSRRFRTAHYTAHSRIVLPAGVFAITAEAYLRKR